MSSPDWITDDDRLLLALRDAVTATGTVPDDVITAAKAAYDLRTLDEELALLTYDSVHDAELAGHLRAQYLSVRSLVFGVGSTSLDIDVLADSFVGQVTPPGTGTVRVETLDGSTQQADVDELGMFTIPMRPSGDVRFRVEPADGASFVTEWTRV